MIRWTSRFLVAAAVALIGVAGSQWRTSGRAEPAPGPHFAVSAPDQDIGIQPVGRTVEFAYRIVNTGDRPIRVIGFEGKRCGSICCLTPKFLAEGSDQTFTIPPGETFTFPCELSLHQPGSIEWSTTVFVEDGGIHPVRLTVRGIAVAVEGTSDGPQGP